MKKIFLNLLFLSSFNLVAQWSTNSAINTPMSSAPKSQGNSHSVSDSKGGVITSWDDNRNSATNSSDIYAQRIDKSGIIKWALNGIVVCSNIATQKSSAIIASNNGSAIITWEDNRNGNYDIYAQKIDSAGNILWTSDGIPVCSKSTNQKNPKLVSDNAGGAIVVWEDSLNFYWDIYAQRISSTGAQLWNSNGISICSAPNAQGNPKIDIDGLGGAIITWQDKRNNVDYDIYAQRINNSGTVLWTANGVVVCNSVNTQNNPRIEPDGSNGALIAWVDKRNAIDNDIYAQHINSSGAIQWTSNGVAVCTASNNQSALDIKYIGAAGLILSWKDERSGANAIYSQIVSTSGTPQLTSNGVLISTGLKSINPNTIIDGNGGAIIAWQDSTSVGWDIKSQKINSTGTIAWTSGGATVSDAFDDQINVSHVTDNNGGAIFVWEDHRNGTNYDLYANHLFDNGTFFVGLNELYNHTLQAVCYPNPINHNSIIKISNNQSHEPWEITIYDSYGKKIATTVLKASESYALNSDDYSSGIYFYSIRLTSSLNYSKGSFISIK